MQPLQRRDAIGQLPTRRPATDDRYRQVVRYLAIQAGRGALETGQDLLHVARWFGAQQRRWSASTIRHYQAALRATVEWYVAADEIDESEASACRQLLDGKMEPISASAPPRTSAKKRRAVSQTELRRILDHLRGKATQTAFLTAEFLEAGVDVGFRPIEAIGLSIVGRQIRVECAKFGNGRGVDKHRLLELVEDEEADTQGNPLIALEAFVAHLQQALDQARSWPTLKNRMTACLRRACVALSIPPIAPYTLRHQFIANAKTASDRRSVAAFAGHCSQRTASRHYATKRQGWKGRRPKYRAAPETLAKVKALRPAPVGEDLHEIALQGEAATNEKSRRDDLAFARWVHEITSPDTAIARTEAQDENDGGIERLLPIMEFPAPTPDQIRKPKNSGTSRSTKEVTFSWMANRQERPKSEPQPVHPITIHFQTPIADPPNVVQSDMKGTSKAWPSTADRADKNDQARTDWNEQDSFDEPQDPPSFR